MSSLTSVLVARIRERGPITVAEFMEQALYHPELGYYSRAARRSGRAGDFFTSVDVGPLFGELVAVQLDEMWRVLRDTGASACDLVEVGAADGRLTRDVLNAAERHHPDLYRHARITLVERSATARASQQVTLGPHVTHLAGVRADLPDSVTGVIFANELLDAFPVHVITRTSTGLREVVVAEQEGALVEADAPLSDTALAAHLTDLAIGARVEVGAAADAWVRKAGAALDRGFLLLFDYALDAAARQSPAHADGTLMSYHAHRAEPQGWLTAPGESDLTAHVDLTAIGHAADSAGLHTVGMVDQTYFLLAQGLAERVATGHDRRAIQQRLAARTLMMPGGLGSTMKALVFSKGVGRPALRGTSSGRLT